MLNCSLLGKVTKWLSRESLCDVVFVSRVGKTCQRKIKKLLRGVFCWGKNWLGNKQDTVGSVTQEIWTPLKPTRTQDWDFLFWNLDLRATLGLKICLSFHKNFKKISFCAQLLKILTNIMYHSLFTVKVITSLTCSSSEPAVCQVQRLDSDTSSRCCSSVSLWKTCATQH